MGVYVDAPMPFTPSRKWPWAAACHLLANTRAEVVAFGRTMGLKPEAFRDEADFPHFWLSPKMRDYAIRLGAFACSQETVALIQKQNRESRQMRQALEAAKREEQPA
jgi:hypothetical protein